MKLRDKIQRPRRPVVIYEILPPRIIDGTQESYAEKISSLLSQTHIDAINIPEVHKEETRGERPVGETSRAEPREFGKLIQDLVGIETIINRVTVHAQKEVQKEWIIDTCDNYEIDNLILVGGESRDINYKGPTVIETSELINNDINYQERDIFCGGIVIPSRERESMRIIEKGKSGIEYFTSQVIYNSKEVIKMLTNYQKECDTREIKPKRILLSFAPISTRKNLEFLKWLGVEFSRKTEGYILEDEVNGEIKNRSIEVSINVFEDILDHITKEGISIPIGLNVEHIMSYNFQYSVELLQKMSKIYRKFCIENRNLYGHIVEI